MPILGDLKGLKGIGGGYTAARRSPRSYVTKPDITEGYSYDKIVSRPLPTWLIARPLNNLYQVADTVVNTLTADVGERPFALVGNVMEGVKSRFDWNKELFDKRKAQIGGLL